MSLEWTRIHPDARGSRSTCGKYSVCSIGARPRDVWETWKLTPGGPWFHQIALGLLSEEAARAVAEADFEAEGERKRA